MILLIESEFIAWMLSEIIKDVYFPFFYQTVDHFAKQSIDPRKPGAGEFLRIVHIERFVHKARIAVGIAEHFHAAPDFFRIVGGVATHNDTHRPDVTEAYVRAADAFAGFSFEEIRIIFAQDQPARVLINRIVRFYASQVGERQEARHIGVVHINVVVITVYFKSIYFSEFGVFDNAVLVYRSLHLVGQGFAFAGKGVVIFNLAHHLGQLAQGSDGKQVRRNQEAE